MHLANLISTGRLATAPVLLLLAWYGYAWTFLAVMAASFASDVVDGYVARRLGQTSELGARLDSIGDFVVYVTLPLGAWWLWPAIVYRERGALLLILACCLCPPLVAFGKFRTITSYHTWGAKLAALSVGGSAMLLFAGGPAWPFHLALPLCVLAALEEIAITLVLPERQTNVRSLWHVRTASRPRPEKT